MNQQFIDTMKQAQLVSLASVFQDKVFYRDQEDPPGRKLTALIKVPDREQVYVLLCVSYTPLVNGRCNLIQISCQQYDPHLLFKNIMEHCVYQNEEAQDGTRMYEWIMNLFQHYREQKKIINEFWAAHQSQEGAQA